MSPTTAYYLLLLTIHFDLQIILEQLGMTLATRGKCGLRDVLLCSDLEESDSEVIDESYGRNSVNSNGILSSYVPTPYNKTLKYRDRKIYNLTWNQAVPMKIDASI